jgi:3-dehydroquinate dehydratase
MINKFNNKLESVIKTLEEMTEVLNKSVSSKEHVSSVMLSKKIEDGLLDNIHNANESQLNNIISNYRFRYYTEYNTDKDLLKSEITKRLRDNKLNKIL